MATVFRLPDIGEGLTEAEIVEWLAAIGDEVTADHPLVVVETDKTQAELPSPITGVLLHRGADEGTILGVGEILAVVGEPGEDWTDASEPVSGARTSEVGGGDMSTGPPTGAPAARTRSLPLVRRAAAEAGIDLADIAGTGPGGRVTRTDLEAHIAGGSRERPPLVGTLDEIAEDLTSPPESATATTDPATSRVVRLSPTRRAIAERVTASWREIPHVTTFDAFSAGHLLARRRDLAARHGEQVPLEALIIDAIVPVLRDHPVFNASLNGDQLTLHGHHDIAFAVDGGDGLLVAVVRDAGGRSVDDVAAEVRRLAASAKQRTLTRDEMTGATFTVSNIGAVGGRFGTPIIPLGTTAILSIGRARDEVVARDGGIHVETMAPLSLSYDHRVIDGAAGRAFLADAVARLEGRH